MTIEKKPSISVERSICCYEGERLVREFALDEIPIEELKRIIGASLNPDDPMLFDSYPLNKDQLVALATFSKEPLPESVRADRAFFLEAARA